MARVLGVTNDDALREQILGCLAQPGVAVVAPEQVAGQLKAATHEILLVDAALGSEVFAQVMASAARAGQEPATIALISDEERPLAARLLQHGARQYLLKPLAAEELQVTLERSAESRRMRQEKRWLWSTLRSTSEYLREVEKQMESHVHAISQLYNMGRVVNLSYVLRELLQMIVRAVCEQLSCESCSIVLLDRSGADQIIHSRMGETGHVEWRSEEYKRGAVTSEIISLGEPVLVEDKARDGRFGDDTLFPERQYKTPSFISVPMRFGDQILAIINAADRTDREPFSEQDLETLVQTSRRIARALMADVADQPTAENLEMLLLKGSSVQRMTEEREELAGYLRQMAKALERTRTELERKLSEISVLYNVGKVIRATFAIEELLKMIVDMVAQSMKCKRCSILLLSLDDETTGEGEGEGDGDLMVKGTIGIEEIQVENKRLAERGLVTQEILLRNESILQVRGDTEDRFFTREKEKGYRTRSFLSVPIKIHDEIVAIINVTDKISEEDFNEDDLQLLEMLAGQASIAIDNFRLSEQLVEKERMDRELQIAYAIQTKLLPERMPEIRNADLFARSIPARQVGGDYFDFFPIDDRRWGLAIGDVSGKGVPAALLMVMLRSLLRAKAIESTSSAVVVSKVNRMIMPDIDPMMFATLFYGIYDSETREFIYTNAGHNYPLCHRRGGDISELETDNLIVGMFNDYAYDEKRVLLSPGDRIVFYTDGITEAQNEAGEMFGARRLRDLLEQPGEHPSQSEVQRIFGDVERFAGDKPQYDDMTLMLLQVR